jgi:hypothetical protein
LNLETVASFTARFFGINKNPVVPGDKLLSGVRIIAFYKVEQLRGLLIISKDKKLKLKMDIRSFFGGSKV